MLTTQTKETKITFSVTTGLTVNRSNYTQYSIYVESKNDNMILEMFICIYTCAQCHHRSSTRASSWQQSEELH